MRPFRRDQQPDSRLERGELSTVRTVLLTTVITALLAVVWSPTAGVAATSGGRPIHFDHAVVPRDGVVLHATVLPDRELLAAEDSERDREGLPFRFALPLPVDLRPDAAGTRERLPDGRELWRLRINCPDAVSLNLGFGRYFLPPGARLQIYATDGSGPVLRYDADDVKSHGELWTPILLTDELMIELVTRAADRSLIQLELSSIGRGYRHFPLTDETKSGSCNVDVVCSEGDPWRDEIDTVGVYSTGGSTFCTGAMINNTGQDGRPFFLTADHCSVTPSNAASIVVYWNFQSPTCGQQGGGILNQFQNGSTLRASNSTTDFKLLELDDMPDPTFGVKYAGWDRGTGNPNSAVAIHHPNTDEKSISFENDSCTTTTYLQNTSPGNGTHIRVADWDLGTTEPGSSGSPLFNQDHRIVGQLHGGQAACDNDEPDWYGRFSLSWLGSGTAATRLSDWLDPVGTGAVTLNLYDPAGGGPTPGPHANLRIVSTSPNPFLVQVRVAYTVERNSLVRVRIYDVRGRLVNDMGSVTATLGANNFFWNGRDGGGRAVAAGVYVLEMTSEDITHRLRVVFLH